MKPQNKTEFLNQTPPQADPSSGLGVGGVTMSSNVPIGCASALAQVGQTSPCSQGKFSGSARSMFSRIVQSFDALFRDLPGSSGGYPGSAVV